MTALRRSALRWPENAAHQANVGLLTRRGLAVWPETPDDNDARQGGQEKQKLIAAIAATQPSDAYRWAYERWQTATSDPTQFAACDLALEGRLYIGLARDNPLETGVMVNHAWGMPLIPGSAVKGMTLRAAKGAGLQSDAQIHLFGSDNAEEPEAGAVVFHDAWWVADAKHPFVAEVVTPHHKNYYDIGAADACDFDAPIPAPQIAVQGRFRFVIEGAAGWRDLACDLMLRALTGVGIGSKTTSGYGLFRA